MLLVCNVVATMLTTYKTRQRGRALSPLSRRAPWSPSNIIFLATTITHCCTADTLTVSDIAHFIICTISCTGYIWACSNADAPMPSQPDKAPTTLLLLYAIVLHVLIYTPNWDQDNDKNRRFEGRIIETIILWAGWSVRPSSRNRKREIVHFCPPIKRGFHDFSPNILLKVRGNGRVCTIDRPQITVSTDGYSLPPIKWSTRKVIWIWDACTEWSWQCFAWNYSGMLKYFDVFQFSYFSLSLNRSSLDFTEFALWVLSFHEPPNKRRILLRQNRHIQRWIIPLEKSRQFTISLNHISSWYLTKTRCSETRKILVVSPPST